MYMYIIDIFQFQVGKFNMSSLEWQKTFGKQKNYLTQLNYISLCSILKSTIDVHYDIVFPH
jgi:hypothetical protein